jgi:hypothetical protein
MAFDNKTRNRLQRFVTAARETLSEEFTRQLQQIYGMDPATGEVTDIAGLKHLDDQRLETAHILRQIMDHYLATATATATGEIARRDVLDRIVREQAFTILNRLAALRMMEARGILRESLGKGLQSQSFQLYQRVANGALGETGETYRCFLLSLFDLFAVDLPALFDRYAPQSRLFPRETVLAEVLEEINHPDLEMLWAEDENIGWIYQYFNSKEERKKMREVRAPRNSRELAVRNQFFTPRYVVEFLVQNTLGRLWFDATGGQTNLPGYCQYLLVDTDERETQGFRPRDPRTLMLLDPACGSMHFGLYAFDLFVEIYREAWEWESKHGAGSLDVSTQPDADLKPLSVTYSDEASFLRDVPRLIIEHNIFGVEIDPRAAQIASLALWLRAQRAWHDTGIKAQDRPTIGRGNVVAAIAPPAEIDLRHSIMAEMDEFDAELFEKTLFLLKDLPELGLILKAELELPALVRQVYGEHGELFQEADEAQWRKAEMRLIAALTEFSKAAQLNYQGRLFAHDALEGLRLIDLAEKQFDVILMNPPFGASSASTKEKIKRDYPHSAGDLLAVFVERGIEKLREGGRIGAITSRSCFFLTTMENWRREIILSRSNPETFADFGMGVMDDAMVEAAAYILRKSSAGNASQLRCLRILKEEDKQARLATVIQEMPKDSYFEVSPSSFDHTPGAAFCYWVNESLVTKLYSHSSIEEELVSIRVGMQTGDDWRFTRLWWEVDPKSIFTQGKSVKSSRSIDANNTEKQWSTFTKTDKASPWFSPLLQLVKWDGTGKEYDNFLNTAGRSRAVLRNREFYRRPGFSYMLRSSRLVPYVVPRGAVPTAGRAQAFGEGDELFDALAICASNLGSACARFNGEKFAWPKFQAGMVQSIPAVRLPNALREELRHSVMKNISERTAAFSNQEPYREFHIPKFLAKDGHELNWDKSSLLGREFESKLAALYGLSESEFHSLELDLQEAIGSTNDLPDQVGDQESFGQIESNDIHEVCEGLISYAVGCVFSRWDLRKIFDANPPTGGDPFDALPLNPPGMLINDLGLPIDLTEHPDEYPIALMGSGILVSDPSNALDFSHAVRRVLSVISDVEFLDEDQTFSVLNARDAANYLNQQSLFFADHLKRYTSSGRKAPIYWPLSTASGDYILWLYYPTLTDQSLYSAANDLVGPKLEETTRLVATLQTSTNRNPQDERDLEQSQNLETELMDLQKELLRLAPHWKPNHDDGVQITAAPLWRLFRHRPWQNLLKETWTKLERGDYDWAHQAMSYWPDRVREKCRTDGSLAVAHNLEDVFEPPPE